jgi:hypothetical protein
MIRRRVKRPSEKIMRRPIGPQSSPLWGQPVPNRGENAAFIHRSMACGVLAPSHFASHAVSQTAPYVSRFGLSRKEKVTKPGAARFSVALSHFRNDSKAVSRQQAGRKKAAARTCPKTELRAFQQGGAGYYVPLSLSASARSPLMPSASSLR